MERNKMTEWQAVHEAYSYILDRIGENIKQTLKEFKRGDDYVVFSKESQEYLDSIMEDCVARGDQYSQYMEVTDDIMESAVKLSADRFSDIYPEYNSFKGDQNDKTTND